MLHKLRIGCVRYLNAKPLIRPYDGAVTFDHPSRLAADLASGALDIGLVPSFELLQRPGYRIVDGISISSFGPVYSVILAHRVPLERVRRVALDPASLTSCNLLRVLLSGYHGLEIEYGAPEAEAEGLLLIGNQAIEFRERESAGWTILDLGEEWTRLTGLPFVFALWLVRPGLRNVTDAAGALRRLKDNGIEIRDQICAEERSFDREFCRRYLGEYIRYELGPEEKAGLRQFESLLAEQKLLPAGNRPLEFV